MIYYIRIVVILAFILFQAYSTTNKYTTMGLLQNSFQSFNEENLGNTPFFNMPVFAPAYFDESRLEMKKYADERVENIVTDFAWWLPSKVQEKARNEIIQYGKELVQAAYDDSDLRGLFGETPWGIVIANADNINGGSDNLFVVTNPADNDVITIDFKNSTDIFKDVANSSEYKNRLGSFSISVTAIDLPTYQYVQVPGGFKNPRGIVTDYMGNYWIADTDNDRVVRCIFNTNSKKLEYVGELTGLDSPNDVAIISGTSTLGIANTGDNSILIVNADFEGSVSYNTLPANQKSFLRGHIKDGVTEKFTSPKSITSLENSFICSYRQNKLVKLDQISDLVYVVSDDQIEWPYRGTITCVKKDHEGNLFVLDNTNSFIGKYNSDLELIFVSGEHWKGPVKNSGKIGFNDPKYIGIGNEVNNFYVTESFEGYNGIKRFLHIPRFMDRSARFQLDCEDDDFVNFEWNITKDAYVGIELRQLVNGEWELLPFTTDKFPTKAGFSTIQGIPFRDQFGLSLSKDGVYKCTYYLYDDNAPDAKYTDTEIFIADLNAPSISHDYVGLKYPFFNPNNELARVPELSFEVTRDAMISLYVEKSDGSGDKHLINPQDMTCYRNSLEDDGASQEYIIPLDIENYETMASGTTPIPYTLKAKIRTLEQCGETEEAMVLYVNEEPAKVYLDTEAPAPLTFNCAFASTGSDIPKSVTDLNAFNPSNDHFIIKSDDAISDNSTPLGADLVYGMRVYKAGEPEVTVATIVGEGEGHSQGVANFYIETPWVASTDLAEGEYRFEATVSDLAGNKTVSEKALFIDKTAPTLKLEVQGDSPQYYTNDGNEHILLTSDMTVNFIVTDAVAKPHLFRMQVTDMSSSKGLTYDLFEAPVYYDGSAESWTGSFTLSPTILEKFPKDGSYKIVGYAVDRAGNSSEAVGIIDPANGDSEIALIWINNDVPFVNTVALPASIKSGESTTLLLDISPSNSTEMNNCSYSYNVDVIHEESNRVVYTTSGTATEKGSQKIAYSHVAGDHPVGKYTFRVTVNDGIGAGKEVTQESHFFVDTYKPFIIGGSQHEVAEKFYIRGHVGDPDLTNDPNVHGFESYSVFIAPGEITALPESFTGWSSANIFVPFEKVSRAQAGFPFSNSADNELAQTQSWGESVLAYVDGSSLAAGKYTLMIVAKEQGLPLTIEENSVALHTVTINKERSTVDISSTVTIDGKTSGDVAVDFTQTNANLSIKAMVETSESSANEFNISTYIYRLPNAGEAAEAVEPIAIELRNLGVSAGADFEFQWDGKAENGSYVPNGQYRVLLVVEEEPTQLSGHSYGHKIISDRILYVSTPLHITYGDLSRKVISKAPSETGPANNKTTFNYRISKPGNVGFDVYEYPGQPYVEIPQFVCTVGPRESTGGSSYLHALSWDGINPETGDHVMPAECEGSKYYQIRPYIVELNVENPTETKKHYFIPSQNYDFYILEITQGDNETPELGAFDMSLEPYYGNSDALWETQLNGEVWTFPSFTVNSDFYVTGTQSVKQNGTVPFDNFKYKKDVEEIKFILKVKWKIATRTEIVEHWANTDWKGKFQNWNSAIREAPSHNEVFKHNEGCTWGNLRWEYSSITDRWFYDIIEETVTFRQGNTYKSWSKKIHSDLRNSQGGWDNINSSSDAGYYMKYPYTPYCNGREWFQKSYQNNNLAARHTITSDAYTRIVGQPVIAWVHVYSTDGTLVDVLYDENTLVVSGHANYEGAGIFNLGWSNTQTTSVSTDGSGNSGGVAYSPTIRHGKHYYAETKGGINVDWSKINSGLWKPLFRDDQGEVTNLELHPGENRTFSDVSSDGDEILNNAIAALIPDQAKVSGQSILKFSIKGTRPAAAYTAPDDAVGDARRGAILNVGIGSEACGFETSSSQADPNFTSSISFSSATTDAVKGLNYTANLWVNDKLVVNTTTVDGVPFPFPSKAGVRQFQGKDLWSGDFHWVMKDGKPDAAYGNYDSDGDGLPDKFKVSLNGITVEPNDTKTWNDLSSVVTPGENQSYNVDFQNFFFTDEEGSLAKTTNDNKLSWDITDDKTLSLDYPMLDAQKELIAWNGSMDNVLSNFDNMFKGYFQVGSNDAVDNPKSYKVHENGFGDSYAPYSINAIDIPEAYEAQATAAKRIVPTVADWKDVDVNTWKQAVWYDGSNTLGLHDGEGFSFSPTPWTTADAGKQVLFRYINGEINNTLELKESVNNTYGTFVPQLAPNALPKRWIPVKYRLEQDVALPLTLNDGDIQVYDPHKNGGVWESVALSAPVEITSKDETITVGYMDATTKAGLYYVRITPRDQNGVQYQHTTTVKIGTEVEAGVPIEVKSPYKRVSLHFGATSTFEGLASVTPVHPSFTGLAHTPQGFYVEIAPSNIMFDKGNQPQLTFYLTKRDVEAINGDVNNLGDIGVYYINPEHKLERAEFAAQVINLQTSERRDIETGTVLGDDEVVIMEGLLDHFSVYGALNEASFVSIDPPVTPTASATIAKVTGTATSTVLNNHTICLYHSVKDEWDGTATKLTAPISTNAGDGTWFIEDVTLQEGVNYFFASIDDATAENKPTNSIKVIYDSGSPIITATIVEPEKVNKAYLEEHNRIAVSVTTNELCDVSLAAPEITETVLTDKVEETNTVYFSLALTDKNEIPLQDGEYTLYTTAKDVVGNVSDINTLTFSIDATVPQVTNTAVKVEYDAQQGMYRVVTHGLARDESGVSSVVITVNEQWSSSVSYADVVAQNFTQAVDLTDWTTYLSQGDIITVKIVAEDSFGNTTTYVTKTLLSPSEDMSKWDYSKEITINTSEDGAAISGDLTDVPTLVRLDKATFDFSQALANGQDIRFTHSTTGAPLPFEIEQWNAGTEIAAIWVKVPAVEGDNNSQTITLHWGNSSAYKNKTSKLVWDDAYKAVYHMNEESSNNSEISLFSQFTLLALEDINLNQQSTVTGDVGTNSTVEINSVDLEYHAQVFGNVIAGENVRLYWQSTVHGDVTAEGTISTEVYSSITGTENEGVPVDNFTIPVKSVTPGITNITVAQDQTVTLAPGSYGDIVIDSRATLELSAGTYNIKSLTTIGNNSFMRLNVSKEELLIVNVAEEIKWDGFVSTGRMFTMNFTGEPAPESVLFYTNQTSKLFFTNSSTYQGVFVAPFAPVEFEQNSSPTTSLTGAVYAKTVTVGNNADVMGVTITAGTGNTTGQENAIIDATYCDNIALNYGTVSSDGIIGVSRGFDGSDDYIEVPTSSSLNELENVTFSSWVNRSTTDLAQAIFSSSNWYVGINGANVLNQLVWSDALTGSGTLTEEQWNHIAAVISGNEMLLYLNGVEVARSERAANAVVTAPSVLGQFMNADWFTGMLDEIRFSAVARSADWVKYAYTTQTPENSVVLVPFNKPANISVVQSGDGEATLTWDTGISSVEAIEIERKLSGAATWEIVETVSYRAGEFIDNTLICGNDYVYRLRYGKAGIYSVYSDELTIALTLCDSEMPSELAVSLSLTDALEIQWQDNSTSETGYEVQYKLHSAAENTFTTVTITGSDATTVSVTGLACEENYDFRIRTIENSSVSRWAYLNGVATDFCNRRPEAPSNLTAALDEAGSVILIWNDNSTNEEYFLVYRKEISEADFRLLDVVDENNTTLIDPTAECGTTYEYAVASFNSVTNGGGASALSNTTSLFTGLCMNTGSQKLVKITSMVTDQFDQPLYGIRSVVVKLFTEPHGGASVFEENHNVDIQNGYTSILLGSFEELQSVLQMYDHLFYELTVDGTTVLPRSELNAESSNMNNSYMLHGDVSPIGRIEAEVGSLYLNTVTDKLYFKYGVSVSDWKSVK